MCFTELQKVIMILYQPSSIIWMINSEKVISFCGKPFIYNSKSLKRMLRINSRYRCSISIYSNQNWAVFPCTPSDVFFEYCLYYSNTSSNSSPAICSWRPFSVCIVWSSFLTTVLNMPPSYWSTKAWTYKISIAASSNWWDILHLL